MGSSIVTKKEIRNRCARVHSVYRGSMFLRQMKDSMAVKTYRPTHNCDTHYKNISVNPAWITQQYLEMVGDTHNLSPRALIEKICKDWMVGISK